MFHTSLRKVVRLRPLLPFYGNIVTIGAILSSPRLIGTHLYISHLIWCVFYPLLPNLAP